MKTNACCTLLASLALTAQVAAQAPTPADGLTITARDVSGAVVANATITLKGPQHSTATKATGDDGTAQFTHLPTGRYSVEASAQGFDVTRQSHVDVSDDKANAITLELQTRYPATEAMATESSTGEFVKVMTSASLGPMGMLVNPAPSTTQLTAVDPELVAASQNYLYPSIIFYIAATPVASVEDKVNASALSFARDSRDQQKVAKRRKAIETANQEKNRFPEWLDATFVLTFLDGSNKPLPDACAAESSDRVQVLGQLPQQTVAATENRPIADISQAVVDTSGALATFYPGTKEQVSSATSAMNVAFKDLFPPRPVAYQYSYLDGSCTMGWYFRPNKKAGSGTVGAASILGLQTGVAMLKVSKAVAKIRVESLTISEWNKRPTTDKTKLYKTLKTTVAVLPLPQPTEVDYESLQSLTMFPALISRDRAKKIVHIDDDADFDAFVKDKNIVTTGTKNAYVTNKSLAQFITPVIATPAAGSTTETGTTGSATTGSHPTVAGSGTH